MYLLILILAGAFVSGLRWETSSTVRSVVTLAACALLAVGFASQRII